MSVAVFLCLSCLTSDVPGRPEPPEDYAWVPPVLDRFGKTVELCDDYATLALRSRNQLEAQKPLQPGRWQADAYDAAIKDAQWREDCWFQLWQTLTAANVGCYREAGPRLNHLKELLGDRAYYGGEMPDPVRLDLYSEDGS